MVLLAKVTIPTAPGLLDRPRLYQRLARKEHPAVTWIVGPPGGGKTSLAIGYARQRDGARLWFQVAAGDRDPAAFFQALDECLRRAARRKPPAGLALGAGFHQDPLAFARRYFERWFSLLAPGSLLVLDDYQELPLDAPVQDLLREGLLVLPPGIQVLVLSRQPPPGSFARLQANGQVALLTWDELRLTEEEALSLLQGRMAPGFTGERAAQLCRLADGWPAGLVLLSAEGWAGPNPVAGPAGIQGELLSAYFAQEVFRKTDAELRSLLLQVALLPRCTAAQARELTGFGQAGARLGALARAGFFTVAHGQVEPAYGFHPLFREFLLREAARTFQGQAWTGLQLRAAGILERAGQIEEAFARYRAQGAVEQQVRLLTAHAQTLLDQGRHRILLALLEALPAGRVERESRLSLWFGLGLLAMDPKGSRNPLERAFTGFAAEADLAGQMLAWCSVVDTWWYAFDDYQGLDPWIQWLDRNLEGLGNLGDPVLAEAVPVRMAWAILTRQPERPDAMAWVGRAERVLDGGSHPPVRLLAGTVALLHAFMAGDRGAWAVRLGAIRPLAEALDQPLALITACWAEAFVLTLGGEDPRRCRALIQDGLELGRSSGIHGCDFWFHGFASALAIGEGDLEAAGRSLEAMAPAVHGHLGRSLWHLWSSAAALGAGQALEALAHAERAVREAEACGQPFFQVQPRLILADLLAERGRAGEAQDQMGRVEPILGRTRWPIHALAFHQGAARQGLGSPPGDQGPALDHLRRALGIQREFGLARNPRLWDKPDWTTSLYRAALDHGIEVEFTQGLIRRHGLRPSSPPLQCQGWPWEIRIATLGRFSIHRDGDLLVFPAKAPRKVLLMLKALIASGPGGISEDTLADQLWPEADGDLARQSFDSTLHRLRQLLGLKGIITLCDGLLALDPYRCWVDAHAFERLLEEGRTRPLALELYRGEFLEGLDWPWARSYRDQLRKKMVQAVLVQGQGCEQAAAFPEAIAWYERGLEADPLNEALYRRIMLCHRATGAMAEGWRVFERCRSLLRSRLDIPPSQETVLLAATLRS